MAEQSKGSGRVDRISLLLPTRGRYHVASRFLQSVVDTTARPADVEVVIYIDEDDVQSHELDHPALTIEKIIGPRITMGSYNTACLERAKGDIIILVNDDVVIQTKGWDERIRSSAQAFSDDVYLAYANDLFKKKSLCAFPVLSRKVCDLLIDPYPAVYKGAFIDTHLLDIFRRLKYAGFDRLCYLEDVVFEHFHYRAGKAPLDETYTERNRFDDDHVFLELRDWRQAAATRLVQAIKGEEVDMSQPETEPWLASSNPISAVVRYGLFIFCDTNISWRWRSWLWVWFCGRYLAARGWLRPFIRPNPKGR